MLEPGARVAGRFHLVEELTQGGSTATWKAYDDVDEALRVLKIAHAPAGRARERFEREATLLLGIGGPHLVRAHGLYEEGTRAILSLGHVDGRTLKELLSLRAARQRHLDADELWRLAEQLGRALQLCHDHGFIHRDLKPANVMNAPATTDAIAHVTLIDFGIAKDLERDQADATTLGRFMGTPRYSAPEQLAAEPVGPGTDVHALTVVIYEAATLRRPWLRDTSGDSLVWGTRPEPPGNDRVSVARRILRATPRPPSHHRPDLPALDDWVAQGLQRQCHDRPTLDAHLTALRLILKGTSPSRPPAPATAARAGSAGSAGPVALGLALVGLLVGAIVLVTPEFSGRRTPSESDRPSLRSASPAAEPRPSARRRPTKTERPPPSSPDGSKDPVRRAPPEPHGGTTRASVVESRAAAPSRGERISALRKRARDLRGTPHHTRIQRWLAFAAQAPTDRGAEEWLARCDELLQTISE